jgi:hypothetical protein
MNQEKTNPFVKICQNLPLDWTFFEENGRCQIPKADCPYNRTNLDSDLQLCSKKTYTPSLPSTRIAV